MDYSAQAETRNLRWQRTVTRHLLFLFTDTCPTHNSVGHLPWWQVADGFRSGAEERPQVLGEDVRAFHRREVSAVGEL
jgi:hypothetical protein